MFGWLTVAGILMSGGLSAREFVRAQGHITAGSPVVSRTLAVVTLATVVLGGLFFLQPDSYFVDGSRSYWGTTLVRPIWLALAAAWIVAAILFAVGGRTGRAWARCRATATLLAPILALGTLLAFAVSVGH